MVTSLIRRRATRTASILALSLAFGSAQAAIVSYDASTVSFQSSDQSMWGSGDAPQLDEQQFIGTTWNESTDFGEITGSERTRVIGTGGTVPNPLRGAWNVAMTACDAVFARQTCIDGGRFGVPPALGNAPAARVPNPISAQYVDTRNGVDGTASTTGRVGIEVELAADSGSVDSEVAFDVQFEMPDLIPPGRFISLDGSSTLAEGAIRSTFPTLEASLSLVAEAQASFTGQGCLYLTGCTTGTVGTGQLGGTFEMISVNENGEGSIEYFDGNPLLNGLLFQNASPPEGFPATVSSAIAEVTAHLPAPNASGGLDNGVVRAQGQDDLLDFFVDVDNIISLGLTGTPNLFGAELSVGNLFEVAVDLIDVKIGPTIDLKQNFEFTPSLYVDFAFSQEVDVAGLGRVQNVTDLLFDDLPDFAFDSGVTQITPTLFLGYERNGVIERGVEFLNELFLDVDGTLRIDALTAQLTALGIFELDPFGIGNIFDESLDLFSSPAIFSNLFGLGGFNDVTLSSFSIMTEDFVGQVPEPNSLMLLGLGLLALYRVRTRELRA